MNIKKGKKLRWWNGVQEVKVECLEPPRERGNCLQVQILAPLWVTADSIKGSAEETNERKRRQSVATRPAARDERAESKRDVRSEA